VHKFFLASFLILSFLLAATLTRRIRSAVATPLKVITVTGLLALLFLVVFVFSLHIGPTNIGALSILKRLFYGWMGHSSSLSPTEEVILFSIRLPRIVFAGIVGAALSVAGVVFQALLRNPLADPYILGISGGSAVGAIIGIILGADFFPFGIPGLAFTGALLTIFLVFGVAVIKRELPSDTLLLSGVIVNTFFMAMIMLLISMSSNTQLHSIFFWLMGDFSLVERGDILFIGLCLLSGFLIIYSYARPLNLIVVGEETAMQLGVPVRRIKILLFVIASFITAVTVSVSGTIGFVGLIIPHMMRMLFGADHRVLLPASLLFGGAFTIAADTIARSVMAPSELPVGVVTAICGAPYFIYLLRKKAL
jgi:iron complex transport system permease protein